VQDQVGFRVRVSDRARRVRVTVDHAHGVEVVLPRRMPKAQAAAAIDELRPWIDRRIRELDRAREAVRARGDTVPYLGQALRLQAEPGRTRVHRRGSALLVPAGAERNGAIERWYRRAARTEIGTRLDRACALDGSAYSGLTIRGQRTRWASCSPEGAMSFNWRLLLAPEPVLEYVVWHEVCHLRVMNHSPQFWALLRARCPDYREQARWLNRHGATLVL
jgi:predicted metal-dependent hydrolase